jgi:hypothetical protein
MSVREFHEITDLRVMPETEAIRRAIALGGEDWEAGIVAAYYRLGLAEKRVATGEIEAAPDWEARNRDFHDALVGACDSQWLMRLRAEDGAIRIPQPDLSKTGGITEGLRIAAMASAWKLPINPHSSATGIKWRMGRITSGRAVPMFRVVTDGRNELILFYATRDFYLRLRYTDEQVYFRQGPLGPWTSFVRINKVVDEWASQRENTN